MVVAFTINGKPYRVESGELSPNTSLNTFIRSHANLTGTKFMCLEGGCGACIVTLKGIHPVTKDQATWAVNSCLFPVFSCHGLDVITVEGLGDRKNGYHVVQSRLAKMHGTQCGYCSPGMVMNMYSLLESKGGKVTMEEVENSFGGNICRCTGYRPILDAYKSLAVDADPDLKAVCNGDIEDLPKKCPKTGENCVGRCHKTEPVHMNLRDGKEWHKVYSIDDILKVLDGSGNRPYMLVAGNTAHGVYRRSKDIEIFLDVNAVEELRTHSIGQTIDIGANIPLAEFMKVLTEASSKPEFAYGQQMVKHIDLVANVPVRNVGSVAGNLTIKHQHNEFPSDIFLLLVAVGATFTIRDTKGANQTVPAEEFLGVDMNKKILTKISLPALPADKFNLISFKITPRAQNAHAYVNAAFLFEFASARDKIVSARICYGGINPKFIRASASEKLLEGADLFSTETIKKIVASLQNELQCDSVMPDPLPEYRRKLAIGLFYKAVLSLAPSDKVKKEFQSGGSLIERPLSKGKQSFDTYKDNWPLTQPVEKLEAMIQTSGEIKYTNDFPTMPNELWAAFVHASEVQAVIKDVDPSDALKIPGVVAFFGPKDIPGNNNFSPKGLMGDVEEIFCSGKVLFHGQPVGMIVAERFDLANEAAKLVKITYNHPESSTTGPIYPTIQDVFEAKDFSRVHNTRVHQKAESRGTAKQTKQITGHFEIGAQFHFSMETQTTVAVPNEDGIDVFSSTQWIDLVQVAIAEMLKIPESSINMQVRRLGGAYGSKISRATQIACAASLACHLLNRPVRFVLTIESNMMAIGKRYACVNDYDVEVDERGKVQKLSNEFWHDYGCSLNEEVGGQAAAFFRNGYIDDHWDVKYHAVQTEAPKHTWCRSPGTTEGIAMIENIMEHISKDLALDPVEVRLANMADDSPLRRIVKDFVKSVEYYERKRDIDAFNIANRWKKRGISIVPMKYLLDYFGSYPAFVAIYHGDGTVAISHGGIEMGQGLNTKIAQIAAHILGVPLDSVKVKATNNLTAANSLVSGGSQTSEAVGYAVKRACEILLERIRPIREKNKEATWIELVGKCFGASIDLTASYLYKKEDLTSYDIWGVSCAEIEIDTLTGMFQLRRVDILEDTGESLSPNVDVGQVEGAFIMGLGYWLHEKLVFNRQNAELLTNRTWTYKPPGAKDIPVDFRITFLKNSSNNAGVLRSKATGEPALCMSIVVLFALRYAIDAARKDSGASDGTYYALGAPTTAENILLLSGNNVDQFIL